MTGKRHIVLIAGCIVTGAAGNGLMVAPASGQTLRPAIAEDAAPLPPLRPRRPRAVPAATEPPAAEPPRTGRMRPAMPEDAGTSPLAAVEAELDAEAARGPSGVVPVPRDGEPDEPPATDAPVDGAPEEPETYVNPDGSDAVLWDARPPEDSDPFLRPPAGYDSFLFQAEVAPILDRRIERLFRFEPWQPRGIRIGSFVLFPTVDIGGAWVSNLFRTRQPRGDWALDVRPGARLVSNWRTHALELRAIGGYSFLDAFPKENDRAHLVEARGRLDVTRRLSFTGFALHEVTQETRGTLDARLHGGGGRADVTTGRAGVIAEQRLNRLSLQLRGTLQQRSYSEVSGPDGVLVTNRDRDQTQTEEAARVTWAFKPTLLAFAEGAINQREFRAPSFIDGLRRDSTGERWRIGVGFGNTGDVVRGEVSLGWGRQRPNDARLAEVEGLIVDANLAWRIDAFTAVLLRANTDVIETSSAGSFGGLSRRATAEIRHAFLRPLIGTASAGYTLTDYQGIALSEAQTDFGLGLEYYLAPEAMLFGRWQHAVFRTSAPAGGWDADEVRIGLRLRQ